MRFREFYRNPEHLIKDMQRWKPGLNYWVGVALRQDTQGGKKENLLAITAAFCDVDCGAAGHKGATSYKDKSEALAVIEAFPLRPSILVDSGGGFQCYWLYQEWVYLSETEIPRVEGFNRGLAIALGGDVAATDAARILRLPGTFNLKIPGNPRPVKIIWCEPERRYDLDAFPPYAALAAEQKRGGPAAHQGKPAPGGEHEAYAQKALANELVKLARTPEGGRNAALNQAAFALGQLVGAGALDQGSVEEALAGVAAFIGLGEVEARGTIKSGIESGMKEPRKLPEKNARTRKAEGLRKGGGNAPQGPEDGEPERIFSVGHCYFKERGHHCLETYGRDGMPETRQLTNCDIVITDEVVKDDDQQLRREFCINGRLDTGCPLPPIQIPAKECDSLSWIRREWGAAVSITPGQSLKTHVLNSILAHSQRAGIKKRTVYMHTGWRKIKDQWRYLHGEGALGPGPAIEVDLGKNLGLYRLPSPGGMEAAKASLRFLDVGSWEVTLPLLACAYLAPFADLLKIDFSLWLYGPTGGMKSTLAALALCHFGAFDRCTLPGGWFSTVNSLEKLCFTLKDSLVVIDDYMPGSSQKESNVMVERAARLIYQAGNRSSRGRLASDLSARPDHYPRCLIISTAEMLLPGQRQSATARYLAIELDPKKNPIDKGRLTAAQKEAFLYPGAMAAYLEDLAPGLDETLLMVKELWESYRGAFQSATHLRIPEIQAWLAVGFEMFLRFIARMKVISPDQANEMMKRAWKVLEDLGQKHGLIIEGERPTLKFLAVLSELFLTRRIFVGSGASSEVMVGASPPGKHLLGWIGNDTANAFQVGYADESMIYLLPNTVVRVVSDALRAQGDYLALGKNELLAALAREGFIEPGKGGKNTHVKRIQGGPKRVICLPRKFLGHDEVTDDNS